MGAIVEEEDEDDAKSMRWKLLLAIPDSHVVAAGQLKQTYAPCVNCDGDGEISLISAFWREFACFAP